jgi:exodeoxyribonuclease VII large subunit
MNTDSERKIFSLREVAEEIRETIAGRFAGWIWIRAEMNKLNHYPHSGHAYPDLVEKQEGKVVAQMRANLWRDDFIRINRQFLQVLKEPLKDGISILLCAKVTFDPVYGLALRILEIDPSYSLGELEREKQETIDRLRKEGIFDQNKKTTLPLLPQRIAVISVETSKGYADFIQVTERNPWGYKFFHMLFPAVLQGDQAAEQIIAQLGRIRKVISHFDVVAIIRGGGGDVGLSCYNRYDLAKAAALFPIPVLTGIGHSTNETVTELVAHRNAITPTELADFLIQQFHTVSVPVKEMEKTLAAETGRILSREDTSLKHLMTLFRVASERMFGDRHKDLDGLRAGLTAGLLQRLAAETREILHLEANVQLTDPVNVLKRGYSITMKDGKAITSREQVAPGDEIETRLYEGEVKSVIQ